MLATGGVILTTAGSLLISRSLELVKPIEFTHMKIGTGDISSIAQARKLNDLVASYKNINMSTLVRSGDLVRVRGSFTNDEITETVRIKEVGVFAKIGTEQPILFGYVNDGEGELIPPGTSGVIARTRDLYIGVTGEAEVAITINKSLVYATIEDLEEGLNRKEDKFGKRSGWNLDKTDLTENDSNKLFTPKGALNLFNTLTTNFTNGINAAKEVLRLDIVKKLNKGAYLGDAQDLKNEIDTKLPINEAYRNYANLTGDTPSQVDNLTTPGKYQCGASGGLYHLSYLDIIQMYPGHVRQIHHDYDNGIQWRDKYNGTFEGMSWTYMWDSLNSPKTHETENQGHKLFTALGALNLKNWLVTNYTTLMNNIRDTLNNSINTKLNHGGYSSTAQQLKNEIDTKLPFSEAWKLFGKEIGANDNSILNTKIPGNYFFQVNTHPKFRVANLEVRALNVFQDHFRQYMYNYDDLTTYVRNVGAGSDTDNPWGAELNTFNVNKFYCPHRIGDIISSTNSANPAATWIGTSWEKLEYCFLYGYNSVGERGGNSAINLTVAQLPPHNMGSNYLRRVGGDGSWDYRPSVSVHPDDASYFNSDTIGSGQPINIMPPYYTVFMWRRIS